MSLCLRCDSAQGQSLSEASCNHHTGARIEAFQPCSLCGAPSPLMILSEQARVAGIQARGHAKLSARWVLAILVFTCTMSLLSLLPQRLQHGGVTAFSNLTVGLQGAASE